jgi:hypothetical protein
MSPRRRLRPVLVTAAATLLALPLVAIPAGSAGAVVAHRPRVLHQGQVTRQDIRARLGSERDTVVEPDVAVSPKNRNIAIAAAHDSRFRDGGAVDISVAWTRNGGATWHHKAVPGITKARGGPYDRASDPVVAFGPDGTAYLSVLLIDATSCPSAVAVLRSNTGGRTWSAPHYAHRSNTCEFSDDKNWLVVDSWRSSPHFGRLYQFWTPFISTGNTFIGSPQAVRWSDDKGTTWSATSFVTPQNHGTQNSQPMIRPNGSIVDTYYDFGAGQRAPDAVPGRHPETPQARLRRMAAQPAAIDAAGPIFAAISGNGGRTWSAGREVTNNGGGFAPSVRCCLFAADIDRVTKKMFVAWLGGVGNTDPVFISFSLNGRDWSSPVRVSRHDVNRVQRVNVDVVARGGRVYVAYGTRTHPNNHGGFVRQQLSVSQNGGRSFGAPMSIGPLSVLRYAARAGGFFPGDYIGEAITRGRLYIVWARSSKPPASSTSQFHQVIDGATLRL